MFDIGFAEMLFVLVIGLIVVGPERLPAVAKTLGLWLGRLKYQFNTAKRDFVKEIGADDIRRQLHNESVMRDLGEPREAIKKVMKEPDEIMQSAKQSASNSPVSNPSINNDDSA